MGKTSCFNPRPIELREMILDLEGKPTWFINVPCNRCENCIRRRRSEWCFRMEEELKSSKFCYFVTLTYEKCPYDKYGNMTLVPKDLSNFLKRLRITQERHFKYLKKGYKIVKGKRVDVFPKKEVIYNGLSNEDKLKFFGCGEYGGEFGRPHYHLIIYNGCRDFIDECWGLGYTHIKKATPESIGYCTKYLDKWRGKKQDWKKCKEFSRMSEGLGLEFVDRMKDFYKKNLDLNFVVNSRGYQIPMPRYYRLRMFDESELLTQRQIIYTAVEEMREDKIKKLGLEEFNRRELDRQSYIKKNFAKGERRGF